MIFVSYGAPGFLLSRLGVLSSVYPFPSSSPLFVYASIVVLGQEIRGSALGFLLVLRLAAHPPL